MLSDHLEGRTLRLGVAFGLLVGSQQLWPATVGGIFYPYVFLLEVIGSVCLAWLILRLLSIWAFSGEVRRARKRLADIRASLYDCYVDDTE